MNEFCLNPELADVSAALYANAISDTCACGVTKREAYVFCADCWKRLERIDRRFPGIAHRWMQGAAGRDRTPGLWLYDLCVDLLRDPRAGTHKKRTNQEEHDGY